MKKIEFITVSNNSERSDRLKRSIASAMAGFDENTSWAFIEIDGQKYDLFSGYNHGARSSSGNILVFLHNDVEILANSIALQRVFDLLENHDTGFVGVCGATRLNAFGTWWGDLPQPQVMAGCRGFVGFPDGNPFSMNFFSWPGGASVFGRVLVADGVLLMCHRRTFDALGGFDETTFKGFHFYDVDITLRAHLAGMKNYVAPVAVFHSSKGNYDHVWEAARQVFVRKHQTCLPIQV